MKNLVSLGICQNGKFVIRMLTIILKKNIVETDIVTLNDFYKILESNPLMDRAMKSLNDQVRMQDEYKEHNNQLLH